MRILRMIKNTILKTITFIAVLTWVITVCLFDSEAHLLQIITVNIVSGLWLISHFLINADYYSRVIDDECYFWRCK